MGLFFKKDTRAEETPPVFCVNGYSTDSARKYVTSPEEQKFFDGFREALVAANKSPYFKTTRMGDGAISVQTYSVYLGKIKLQGKTTWMQYMTSTYNSKVAENESVERYIELTKYWVRTIGRTG